MASGARAARSLRLMVRDLPWTVATRELRQHFTKFGGLKDARVIFDRQSGMSKGYGFIQYRSKEAFDTVLSQESHILEGNRVRLLPIGERDAAMGSGQNST